MLHSAPVAVQATPPTPDRPATALRAFRAFAGLFLSAVLLLPGVFAPLAMAAGTTPTSAKKAATKSSPTTASAGTSTHHRSKVRKSTVTKSGGTGVTSKHHRRVRVRTTRRPAAYSGGANARAALVVDATTGEVLFDKNSGQAMPIASLTKLMTAMVFLEMKPDLSRRVMVSREDLAGSGHTKLRAGEIITMRDLLHMALLSSDNAATRTLVRNADLPPEEFLARMNRKAQVMGLQQTRFVEFTGLSEQNVSSATEYAQILKRAGGEPMIRHITMLPDYTFRGSRGDHHLVNTNRLCRYGVFDVRGGKTGFISESGYCLATWVTIQSREVISVVLGAPSNSMRFSETRRLIDRWADKPPAQASTITAMRGAD